MKTRVGVSAWRSSRLEGAEGKIATGRTARMAEVAARKDRRLIPILLIPAAAGVVPVPSGLETALIHQVAGTVPQETEPRPLFAPGARGSTDAHAGVSLSAFGDVVRPAQTIVPTAAAVIAPNRFRREHLTFSDLKNNLRT